MTKTEFLTKPTGPGWYWFIERSTRRLSVVYVRRVLKRRFRFRRDDYDDDYSFRLYSDADKPICGYRLVGPITPPDVSELEDADHAEVE